MKITNEHIILLEIIRDSENPVWPIISKSKPTGMLWTPEVVANLIHDLTRTEMITQASATSKIELTGEGRKQIEHNKSMLAKEEELAKMSNEKLHLEIETLRNDFLDYPETKSNARKALIIAGIAAAAAVAAVIIALFK